MGETKLYREIAEDISGDLGKYPALEDYQKGLNELLTMNLNELDLNELERLFFQKAILFQQAFGINHVENFNQRTFYRVRMNIGTGEDPGLIRTHSYPPAAICKTNGRANLKGKSVFYCSDHSSTSIIEARPQPGQVGYLSQWEGNTQRDVKYGICLPRDLRAENSFSYMAGDIHAFVKENSTKLGGEKAEHFTFFFKFIAERFVNEKYPYPLTSWLGNEMLYGAHWKDFILYPSVANSAYACNMAFHPNSADTLLRFKKVLEFKMISINGTMIEMTDTRIGELSNSEMKWRRPNKGELSEMMPNGTYAKKE